MLNDTANFRYIEDKLYRYYELIKYIEDREDDIINSTGPQSDGGHGSSISDITGQRGMQLADNQEIMELKRVIRAIEKTVSMYQTLDPLKYDVIKLKYFDKRFTDFGITKQLNISRRTFYRYRREAIACIGKYLGIMIRDGK